MNDTVSECVACFSTHMQRNATTVSCERALNSWSVTEHLHPSGPQRRKERVGEVQRGQTKPGL